MAADLTIAQEVLRGLRSQVSEVDNGFVVNRHKQDFLVKHEDLERYLLIRKSVKRDLETQIYFPGYYEHVVRLEGYYGLRRSLRGSDDVIRLDSPDKQTTIEVGRISNVFCLAITDIDSISPQLRRFSMLLDPGSGRARQGGDRPVSDIFRLITIKVITSEATVLGRNLARLHELAEAAAFHIAFGQGTSVTFAKSWERTYYWIGKKEEDIQFPRRIYDSELVSYYNLALSSDSLVLSYLALYNILEFFYTSVSESAIHEKLREQIVAPDFNHTKPKKLRELVKIIRQFDSKLDEVNALKLVLDRYFDKAGLRSWFTEYEKENGQYFTVSTLIFGLNQRVDMSDSSIIPNLASRIYLIRNALVHNKEGEISRFIPYSGQEEMLAKEIQILLFLAEQLIIKTGKDIA